MSVAATARVIELCACVGWCKCAPCLHYCQGTSNVIFAYAIDLSSIFYSKITVIHDTSRQIKQRSHIGKIFALWHLAIAITSKYFEHTYINLLKVIQLPVMHNV